MMLVPTYYLPIHFEVVRDHSATKAGLDLLGLVISLILTSMLTGIISRKIGSYQYFVIAGPMVTMIGAGLLFTIVPTTSFAKIIGFEIIVGVGVGAFFQLGMLAAQAEFAAKPWMMGKVMGVVGFGNTLGAIIGLAVSGSVFEQRLSAELNKCAYLYELISWTAT
jgi:MFS family permease